MENTTLDKGAVSSILECSVCLSLLCEPITVSCGHTFCRVCLVKSLRRHKKQCPSCRQVCHISAENAPENVTLKALAQLVDANLYESRSAETAAEKGNWAADYPVFFYNQTMLPGNKLSLHLFEPRYKLMMNRIVNTSRCFAYVSSHYAVDEGDIALVAELNEAEFLADGRCILEATLCKRSRIVEHHVESGTQGLHYCRLEPFHDEPVPAERSDAAQQLKARAVELAEQLLSQGNARRIAESHFGAMPADLELFSMWFASVCPLSESDKIVALHSRDTMDRLQLCAQAAEAYLTRRFRGGSFPLASALGASIASTISALMGRPASAATAAAVGAATASSHEGGSNAEESRADGASMEGEGGLLSSEGDSDTDQDVGGSAGGEPDGLGEEGAAAPSTSSSGLPGYSH